MGYVRNALNTFVGRSDVKRILGRSRRWILEKYGGNCGLDASGSE